MSAKRLSIPTFASAIVLLTAFSLVSRAEEKNQTVQNKIAAALANRLAVDYIDTPLNAVADDLHKKLGVPVMLDFKALGDVGIGLDTPVTFRSDKTSARSAIRFMLERLGLTIITQNNIVLITTPDFAQNIDITKIYQVHDLVYQSGVPEGTEQPDFDSLYEVLTCCVRPSTWSVPARDSFGIIDVSNLAAISVRQIEEVHPEVERLLSDLRAVRHKATKDVAGQPPLPAPIATPLPPDVKAIRKALDKPVTLKFEVASLNEAAWQLEKALNISVRIDHRALADLGVDENESIKLSATEASPRSVIPIVLERLGLTTIIAHESLVITTPEEAETRLTTRVYDVADLFYRDPKYGNQYDFESLLEMINWCIAPTTWGEVGGPGTIMPYEADGIAAVVVSQTDAVHDEIEKLLAQLRTFRHSPELKSNERTAPLPSPISIEEKAIRDALDKPVTLKYDKTPLEAVVKDLKEKLCISICTDHRALEDLGIEPTEPITFAVSDVSARTAIALMLRKYDLSTTVLDGSLVVTTPEETEIRLITRIYDVADFFPHAPKNSNKKEYDAFLDPIRNCIAPSSWDVVGGTGTIDFYRADGIAVVVVMQTYSIQYEIEQLLAHLRAVRHTSPLKPKERIAPIQLPISKAEKTLREALAKPISLQFKDAKLTTVVDSLKEKTGLQIFLDEKHHVSQKTLTLSVQDIQLEAVLNLICRFYSAGWTFCDGYLMIVETDEEDFWHITRVYDVSDLPYYRDERGNGAVDYDELITFLTCSVVASSWDEVGGMGAIAPSECEGIQSLVVRQTWRNHREIERVLAEVRRLRGPAPTKEDLEKLPPPPKPPAPPKPEPQNTPPEDRGKGMF